MSDEGWTEVKEIDPNKHLQYRPDDSEIVRKGKYLAKYILDQDVSEEYMKGWIEGICQLSREIRRYD